MRNRPGFTLVEIITVIAIMSILAAIAIPGVVAYIDDANDHQYAIEARSVYSTAMIEQDKYRISTGLSLAELYQNNSDMVDQMIDQVNKTLDTQNLTLIDLAYFTNAIVADGLDIPANSYLLRFNNGKSDLDALVNGDNQVTIITGIDPWDFVVNDETTTSQEGSTGQDGSSSSDTGSGTGTSQPDNSGTATQPTWIDTAKLVSDYNSTKYDLGVDYAKSNSKQLTWAYQDYLLENGYPIATAQEMALINTNTTFYWVPIVTPDKTSVFFVGSYDSGDTDKVSTTIVCIDGKYYQYVNTKNTAATIAINDDGSDYNSIIKATNVNDMYYLGTRNTEYWIRIK